MNSCLPTQTRCGRGCSGSPDVAVPDSAAFLDEQGGRLAVRRVLEELSPQDRELITLIAWEGLTPTQAAAVLDLSPATARVRLHRARARLRSALTTHAEEADRDQ